MQKVESVVWKYGKKVSGRGYTPNVNEIADVGGVKWGGLWVTIVMGDYSYGETMLKKPFR